MFEKFRKSKACKVMSVFIAFNFLTEVFSLKVAQAITTGPTHPEVQSFEPVDASEMVDLFSGDFTYNIPLLDVEGYPVNIFYHSGNTMEDEASWVGLGWNINVGSVTRTIRGLPDDFNGDTVETVLSMKPNRTYGVTVGAEGEIFGSNVGLGGSIGLTYNNYVGLGIEQSFGTTFSLGEKNGTRLTGSLGVRSSNTGGTSLTPGLSLSCRENGAKIGGSLSAGLTINSREGMSYYNFGMGMKAAPGKAFNFSTTIPVGPNTYIPETDFPHRSKSITLEGEIGGTCYGFDVSFQGSAYYNEQTLATQTMRSKSYGYLYSEKGFSRNDALLDFNREKDGVFSRNTPALPVTNYTYDVYAVSGQGTGGIYRPYRSDYGYTYDPEVESTSDSYSIGLEADFGCMVKGGADVIKTDVTGMTGRWDNDITKQLCFTSGKKSSDKDYLYEPYYFKKQGDIVPDPMAEIPGPEELSQFDSLGAYRAVRANLDGDTKFDVKTNGQLIGNDFSSEYHKKQRHRRQKRKESIQTLTKEEIERYYEAKIDQIENFDQFKPHHILQIIVTNPDGTRYVYGQPGLQSQQIEVTFNASGRTVVADKGQVSYDAGKDNSTSNDLGIDHYYRKRTIGKYVHNYYLTEVLSADYVDVTGDGPSDDDMGTFVQFKYSSDRSLWRAPFEESKANYSEGLKTKSGSLKGDEKGSYIYGDKYYCILDTIKTKNYIVVFTKEDSRRDCRNVQGENGGLQQPSAGGPPCLEKISLFSKPDLYENKENAFPIKEVHFEYNYELCPGVPNFEGSESGKLTLEKLYFSYGKSNRGRFSPYIFGYSETNPSYCPVCSDRWGYYKPNTGGYGLLSPLSNIEYPYAEQDKESADENMSAWNLCNIRLPSGGSIHIEYESDDYAYVQDKHAAQMMRIDAIGEQSPVFTQFATLTHESKLYFRLPDVMNEWTTEQVQELFSRSPKLYFRSMARVNNSNTNQGYEYVSGYADIAECGIYSDNNIKYIYLILEPVKVGNLNTEINPISAAAVLFGRIHTPDEIYSTWQPGDNPEEVLKGLINTSGFSGIKEAINGQEEYLYNHYKIGTGCYVPKTWIRVPVPDGHKLGGGARVKEISVTDNWDEMNPGSGLAHTYYQHYKYETTNSNGEVISSGVACYEPAAGGDENPLKLPVYMGNENPPVAPEDRSYLETPFGESFFPAPSVGYSKVTVENRIPESSITRHQNGYKVHEFYTAFDYPVITEQTEMQRFEHKSSLTGNLLKINVRDFFTASQGYAVMVNDMHGKPKAVWEYAETGKGPVKGVEYFYKDNGTASSEFERIRGNRLENNFTVIKQDGSISETLMGVDFDFMNDSREHYTQTSSMGVQLQVYGFMLFIFPIAVPAPWPVYNSSKSQFRSIVTTKVIQQYGILDQVISYNEGSRQSTKVLALDHQTGEALLTSTTNEYKDPIYKFEYPAHLAYQGMDGDFRNINAECQVRIDISNKVIHPASSELLVPGNELGLYRDGDYFYAWVWKDDNGDFYLLNRGDELLEAGEYAAQVLRSGYRNLQTISIGEIVSMTNPLGWSFENITASDKILDASAATYNDHWQAYCQGSGAPNNPFLTGNEGSWRFSAKHYFNSEREQASPQSNIRTDGTYHEFSPCWKPDNESYYWTYDDTYWTWQTKASKFSSTGFEIEQVDKLGNYTSVLYKYNNSLPVAIAKNARHDNIAYDGFEDYFSPESFDGHFDFKSVVNVQQKLSTGHRHTGKYSIEVSGNSVISKTCEVKQN